MASLRVFGGWRESRGRGADPGSGPSCTAATTQTVHLGDLGQHPDKGILIFGLSSFINNASYIVIVLVHIISYQCCNQTAKNSFI